MLIIVAVFMAIIGAMFGSFACCQVWRIKKNDKSKWSHCMHCNYRLQWYDNLPVISWLMLGGKCRKCRKKIGCAEFFAELGMLALFVASWLLWGDMELVLAGDFIAIMRLVIYLLVLTCFCVCFIYDAKWMELPTVPMYIAMGLGVAYLSLGILQSGINGQFDWGSVGSALLGLVLLPGFYLAMYKISNESWVGGGDWLLCIPIALMLGNAWLSLSCLFVSNLIGCMIMLPVMLSSKKKQKHIPMGPFLILGFLVIFFAQNFILEFVNI